MRVVREERYAILYPEGYLNGPMGETIDACCGELLREGVSRLLINFGGVEMMNTMGMSNLVSILEKSGRRNGVVVFCELLPTNRQMLDVLDLSRAVLIFDSEAEAVGHLENL